MKCDFLNPTDYKNTDYLKWETNSIFYLTKNNFISDQQKSVPQAGSLIEAGRSYFRVIKTFDAVTHS